MVGRGLVVVSTFFDRIDELSDAVGHGTLIGKVEVDQRYAEVQERHEEFKHPRGGQAYALRDALIGSSDRMMQTLAARAITPDGSELVEAMKDNVEHVSDRYHELAPVEYDYLRRSGHPSVIDEGAIVYDRAPHAARLSDEQLRARSEAHEKHPDR